MDVAGGKALIVATNHGMLDIGKPIGVFASELTAAYYAFLDAGMDVDVASPAGGVTPVDPLSVNSIVRTAADDRLLADHVLRAKITNSLPVRSVDINAYDIVYLTGGLGAAFDLGLSEVLWGQDHRCQCGWQRSSAASATALSDSSMPRPPMAAPSSKADASLESVTGRSATCESPTRLSIPRQSFVVGGAVRVEHPDHRHTREPLGRRRKSGHRPESKCRSMVAREMLRLAQQHMVGRN